MIFTVPRNTIHEYVVGFITNVLSIPLSNTALNRRDNAAANSNAEPNDNEL